MSLQLLKEMMEGMEIQLVYIISKIIESKKLLTKLGAIIPNL